MSVATGSGQAPSGCQRIDGGAVEPSKTVRATWISEISRCHEPMLHELPELDSGTDTKNMLFFHLGSKQESKHARRQASMHAWVRACKHASISKPSKPSFLAAVHPLLASVRFGIGSPLLLTSKFIDGCGPANPTNQASGGRCALGPKGVAD